MMPSRRAMVLAAMALIPAFLTLAISAVVYLWAGYLLLLGLAVALDVALAHRQRGVSAERHPIPTLHHGHTHAAEITVHNPSPFALVAWLRDDVPAAFAIDRQVLAVRVAPGGSATVGYALAARQRGLHRFGELTLRHLSPLGLLVVQRGFAAAQEVRVLPDIPGLARYVLLARLSRYSEMGVKPLRFRGAGTDFESLRQYVEGDDYRSIDWKATARHGRPISREFEVERNHEIVLAIDSGRLMGGEVGGVTKLDHAVNAALALAGVCEENSDRVGVLLFSNRVKAFLRPTKERAQLRAVLDVLYDAQVDPVETHFTSALAFLGQRQKKRAMVVVLTDFADRETSAGMIASVLLQARRHLFLFVAIRDPLLQQTVRARAVEAGQPFRHAVAYELQRERREVLTALRAGGVHTLDLEPTEITAPTISKYLEIRGRNLL